MTELGFLGAGNMGSAIMRGICSSDMQISVSAYDKDTAKLEANVSLLKSAITYCLR